MRTKPNVSGEDVIVSGMAGRYATALFELADETNALDAVARDLGQLAEMMRASKDLVRVVRSPLVSREEQARAMAALLDRIGAHDLTRRFVGLLAQKRRLFALADMIRAYRALLAQKRGEMTAHVTSAHPLDSEQRAALSDILHVTFKRDVKLETTVDQNLLGGLIVKVGSRMIDSSLATKLDRLKLAMREA